MPDVLTREELEKRILELEKTVSEYHKSGKELTQKQLKAISKIGMLANSTLNLKEVLTRILKSTIKTLNGSAGMILLKNPVTGCLFWGASSGLSDAFVNEFKNRHVQPGESLSGHIAQTGQSIYIPVNSSQDERIVRPVVEKEGLNSFIGVPIHGVDEIVGVMVILTHPPDILSESDKYLCKAIGLHVGSAIRNAQLFDEHKRIEESLRESEERFKTLSKFSFEGIMIHNNGVIIDSNDALTQMLGYTRKELIGENIIQLCVPLGYHAVVRENMVKSYAKTYEGMARRKEGTEFPVEIEARDIIIENKKLRVAAVRDISERRQADEKLRASEERYHRITANIPGLVYQFVLHGNGSYSMPYISEGVQSMFGVSSKEVSRDINAIMQFMHPDDVLGFERSLVNSAESLSPYNHQFRALVGEETVWINTISLPKRRENGDISWDGILLDISERKEVEQKIVQRERQLMESQAVARLGSWDSNLITLKSEWSAESYKLFDKKIEEFTPGFSKFIQRVHPDDVARFMAEWDNALESGNLYRMDVRIINDSGREWVMEVIGRVVERDIEGKVVRVAGTIQDITLRKQAEEALIKAYDELERRIDERTLELKNSHEQLLHSEKLAAIGGLSASIAHEFNNPLQGIMTVIQGVQRRAEMEVEDMELIDMAIKECDRMKDLISSLQDFNRPSSGEIAPMNIHAAIDSLLVLGKKEYVTKGIIIKTHLAEDMVQIEAVSDQLKQVLLNLFNNAAYACEGGGTITVSTEVDTERKSIAIKIKDSGKGIKSQYLDKIFDPFFTTKPAVKGTGLGLSISYGIIKKHGGRIDVISEPGAGTTFTITLPVKGMSAI